jgi:hypothetical protein
VLGRAQFPDDTMLSRRHAELNLLDGDVFIKDLGSVNGTFLRNRKLTANEPMKLSEGDRLRIGQTEFTLMVGEEEFDHFKSTWAAVALGFFAIFCGAVLRPSAAYGLAFTPKLLLMTFAVVALATFLSAVFWNFVLSFKQWTSKVVFLYFVLVILSGSAGAWGIWFALDADWNVADHFTTAKIEYFCFEKFEYARCEENLHLCALCSINLEPKKQAQIILNIREAQRKIASPSPASSK